MVSAQVKDGTKAKVAGTADSIVSLHQTLGGCCG